MKIKRLLILLFILILPLGVYAGGKDDDKTSGSSDSVCMEGFTFQGDTHVCEARYAKINGQCPTIQNPYDLFLQPIITDDNEACYYYYLPEGYESEGIKDFDEDEQHNKNDDDM